MGRSLVFLSSWLKQFFLLFYFNFQVRKKNAGQSFLAMKEVHKCLSIVNFCFQVSFNCKAFFGENNSNTVTVLF